MGIVILNRRRFLRGSLAVVGLGLLAGCSGLALQAERPARVRRLGFVGSTGAQIRVAPFEEGLSEWGYLEGQNVRTEYRWADTDDGLRAAVTDLVEHVCSIFWSGLWLILGAG